MPITTFSTDFQSRPVVEGPLGSASLDQLRREAFPLSPPANPGRAGTEAQPWRSYKLAPLPDKRLLVSVVADRGNTDHLDRPVISATGCVLRLDHLDGPLRDIGSLWGALDALSAHTPPSADAVLEEVTRSSPLCSDAAFAELSERLSERGAFYAYAAATISRCPTVDMVLPMHAEANRHLLAVMLLVPLDRLMRLHLATGATTSDKREMVLGVQRAPPRPGAEREASGGLLGSLSSLTAPAEPVKKVPLVDFGRSRVVDGPSGSGPLWLSKLGARDSDWPGLSPRERFALLVRTGDARVLKTADTSLFSHKELDRVRRMAEELQLAEDGLKDWR